MYALLLVALLAGGKPVDLPVLPEAITSFGAATIGETVYVYGGHSGMAHHYSTAHHSYSFASLRPGKDKAWKELPFDTHVQGFGFVAHGKHLYRLGGSQAQNDPDEEEQLISLASVHRFDTQSGKWEVCTPLPEARSSFNAAVVGDYVYVAGGWLMPVEGKRTWLPNCWKADLRQWPLKWEAFADLPDPRRAHAAVSVGSDVVLIGGMDDEGTSGAVSIFDTRSGQWRKGADFPPGGGMKGFGVAACVLGKQVVANAFDGVFYRYDVGSDRWLKTPQKLEKPRFFHFLVTHGDEVITLGGSTRGGHSDVVQQLSIEEGSPAGAANWRGFRNDGRSISEQALPLRWSPKDGIAWRQATAGFGQSSPVVWNGQAIVASVEGSEQDTCWVQAFDLMDGRELWRRSLPASQKQKNDFSMARAAASPVADADGIYVFFPGGVLAGLTHGGEVRWQRSLTEDFGAIENRHGLGGSLCEQGDLLYALVDDTGPSYLLAVNKKDGKTAWKTERSSRRSWTTPVMVDGPNGPLVVVSSNGTVDAYDARSGKQQWNIDEIKGNTIASATPAAGGVLIGAGPMRGGVDASMAARNNRLIDASGKTVWHAEKAAAHYASPLAYMDHAYFVNRVGAVTCLDLKTGAQRYAERVAGECWATPIAADGHIFFFTKNGDTSVIKAGPKFELVTTNKLFDKVEVKEEGGRSRDLTNTVHGVAASSGRILVRTGAELVCISGVTQAN